jgi:hypothetical protein
MELQRQTNKVKDRERERRNETNSKREMRDKRAVCSDSGQEITSAAKRENKKTESTEKPRGKEE